MSCLYRSLSAQEPYNSWLFCGKRPTTKGIFCIFATLYHTIHVLLERTILLVSFRKRATNDRALLLKETYKNKASYVSIVFSNSSQG